MERDFQFTTFENVEGTIRNYYDPQNRKQLQWKVKLTLVEINCNLIWKETSAKLFSVEFGEISNLLQIQKQTFAGILHNGRSLKICKIHGKTPVLVFLFCKATGLQPTTLFNKRLQPRCFLKSLAKFLGTLFLYNTNFYFVLASNVLRWEINSFRNNRQEMLTK